jgi:uncharacterized protein YkwD
LEYFPKSSGIIIASIICVIRTLFFATLIALIATPAAQAGGDFDSQLFAEINLARTQPQVYAGIVAERGAAMRNSAGAIQEAVKYLQKAKSKGALIQSPGLTQSAFSHVLDTGPRGIKGHVGTDGSHVNKRANRFGRWDGLVGENICYGNQSARDVIVCLIIDEGISNRYHRKNIFGNYRYMGVASGSHATAGLVVVTDFAASYREQGSVASR